jgi:hypothetical protein
MAGPVCAVIRMEGIGHSRMFPWDVFSRMRYTQMGSGEGEAGLRRASRPPCGFS